MAARAEADFRIYRVERDVFKKDPTAFFRIRYAFGEPGIQASPSKVSQRHGAEEIVGHLKLRDSQEIGGAWRLRVLRMAANGIIRLCHERRGTSIKHEDGVQGGSVEGRRNAASQGHTAGIRVILQGDVGWQRDRDQNCRVLQHPADAMSLAVVAAIMEKEGVLRVFLKTGEGVRRRDGPRVETVTGKARSAVAPERLTLEEPLSILALADAALLSFNREYPGQGNHRQDEDREQ